MRSTNGGDDWDALPVEPPEISFQGVKNRILRVFSRTESLTLRKRLALLKFDIWSHGVRRWPPLYLPCLPALPWIKPCLSECIRMEYSVRKTEERPFSLLWDTLDMHVRSLVVSPHYSTDRTLFVSLDNALYTSHDGGGSWEPVESAFDFRRCVLVISPQYEVDQTLFAGGLSGLFRTRDGGETWEKLRFGDGDLDMPIAGLAISPCFATDRQIVVQVGGGELFLCRDYGDTFEAVPSESADSGYEFSQIIQRESAPLMKFSPNYDKDTTLYAASMHELVKSTDGGKTWVEVPRPIRYESERWPVKGILLSDYF